MLALSKRGKARLEGRVLEMAHYQITSFSNGSVADRAAAAFATAREAFAQYRSYRITVEELRALSDRELSDLNIARGAIRGIARESVYGQ